jgi:hypothetical protein
VARIEIPTAPTVGAQVDQARPVLKSPDLKQWRCAGAVAGRWHSLNRASVESTDAAFWLSHSFKQSQIISGAGRLLREADATQQVGERAVIGIRTLFGCDFRGNLLQTCCTLRCKRGIFSATETVLSQTKH